MLEFLSSNPDAPSPQGETQPEGSTGRVPAFSPNDALFVTPGEMTPETYNPDEPEVEAEEDSTTAEETHDPQLGLDAILDLHDNTEAPQNGETAISSSADVPVLDWDDPKVQAFGDNFQQILGVDLKEAIELFSTTSAQLQQVQKERADLAYQGQVQQLQQTWGVNEAELNTRLERIADYALKLDPAIQKQLDNPEGFKYLWDRLEAKSRKANGAAPPVAAKSTEKSGKYRYRTSQLHEMMRTNPAEYSRLEKDIAKAYDLGQVLSDV